MKRWTKCCAPEGTAVALGMFDGLHLGHRSVLQTLKKKAKERSLPTLIYTFSNLPSAYFGGESGMIFTPDEKEEALSEVGIDYLLMPQFDAEVAETPREIFARFLFQELKAKVVCVGFNYRFGKGALGTPLYLKQWAEQYGAELLEQPPFLAEGKAVSSTRIRCALRQGNIKQAAELLGRPYEIVDIVAHGKQLGRQMGFPTLNFYPPKQKLMPKHGVYAAEVELEGQRYAAVTNIGIRPTVKDGDALSVESNLAGFEGDAYGKKAKVRLLEFLRGEQKFESLDALICQIEKDKKIAQECVNIARQRGLH